MSTETISTETATATTETEQPYGYTQLQSHSVAELRKIASSKGIGTGGWRVSASKAALIQGIVTGVAPTLGASTPQPALMAPPQPRDLTGNRLAEGGARPIIELVYPEVDPTLVVDKKVETLLEVVMKIPNGKIRNILLTGPAGCGKTDFGRHAAAMSKAPFFDFSVALYREPIDLFGEKGVANGQTFFMPSRFIEAVETPNAVILIDEINRATPLVANGLLPLLDHRKQAFIEGLNRVVRVADNVTFIATANVGTQYTGTFRLDAALSSRFPYRVEVTYLNRENESNLLATRCGITPEDANALANVAETIRSKSADFGGTLSQSVATRELIAAGWLVAGGLSTGQALTYTIVPNFDADGAESSERAQVLQTIQLVCGL